MTRLISIRCGHRENPLGIGTGTPRFAYRLDSDEIGIIQCSRRFLAASTEEKLRHGVYDLWDSGEVGGTSTLDIPWGGEPLGSRKECYYKILCTLSNGKTIESDVNTFETGLLKSRDFTGRFISCEPPEVTKLIKGSFEPGYPCSLMRKSFLLRDTPAKARLYITALGLYHCKINGSNVTDSIFNPGWTSYEKLLQYQTYDVTALLREGRNVISAVLADGWYAGCVGLFGREYYSSTTSFFCQLEATSADDETVVIRSDSEWKYAHGPFLSSDLIMGETYDATREIEGWELPAFDDGGWSTMREYFFATFPLMGDFAAQSGPPVRVKMTLQPAQVSRPMPDTFIFDLGQNMVGRTRLRIRGTPGKKVILRFGEMLDRDGSLYTENLRHAKATDTYVCAGGDVTYEQSFTFHGFRYVEVTGLGYTPSANDLTGCVIYSDLADTGNFECGIPKVNRLYENAKWSQRGNFLDIPTDCPQRDERLGWTGDAQIFSMTACYNMDCAGFFRKWLRDMMLSQRLDGGYPDVVPYVNLTGCALRNTGNADRGNPAWAEAGVVIPYLLYLFYGDTEVLADHFASIEKFMDFLRRDCEGFIRPNVGYGDWLSVGETTPKDIVGTAYFARCAALCAKMARVLGKEERAAQYDKLFTDIQNAFINRYVDTDDGTIEGDTQTCYLLAVGFGILEGELARKAVKRLLARIDACGCHLSSGFVGIDLLLPVLTEFGYAGKAYDLLLTETYPSWLYPVNNGATTIWERWNSYTLKDGFASIGMNSFNHYSLGSVVRWMYQYASGIRVDEAHPGFTQFDIRPFPDTRLKYVRASYESISGRIESSWRFESDVLILAVSVPANTTARLYIPATWQVLDGSSVLSRGESCEGNTIHCLVPGKYELRCHVH